MLQVAKKLLNNDERLLLIEKYKEDKLNSPPSNIKDETLITNYGTDEQKARLRAAPAAKAPKATENKTAEPAAGAGTEPAAGTGSGDTGVGKGNAPVDGEKPNGEAAPAATPPAPDKNQEYVKAFNEYVDLYFKMPADTLTAEQLIALNEQKRAANAKAQEDAELAKEQASKQPTVKAADSVTIVNNKTKEKSVIPRLTWDKFISKDGTHTLQAEPPAELNNL